MCAFSSHRNSVMSNSKGRLEYGVHMPKLVREREAGEEASLGRIGFFKKDKWFLGEKRKENVW